MDKTYTPQTIPDQPFPDSSQQVLTVTQAASNGTTSQPAITDQGPPLAPIARELISQSLNTKSKKILQSLQFAANGAMAIGTFQAGVSGDIRLSPDGIVGRDITGETTFALDGDTGDATLKGTLEAGSLIAGDGNIIIGEDSGHGQILFLDGTQVAIVLGWGDF